ncbi:MAG: tetratricopeptide repeat protein [Anaeromyxobacteraceae bacterium]
MARGKGHEGAAPGAPLSGRHGWLEPAALFALSLALYLPSLGHGFVWDDQAQVVANRWLSGWGHLPEIFGGGVWDFDQAGTSNYYRPLMHVAYLAVGQAFGRVAWAYHLLNVLVNAAVPLAVLALGRALREGDRTAAPDAALAAGVLFAVHPVHSEAVLWIAALPELLATAFALLALLAYVRALRPGGRAAPWLGAAAYLAGGLSKEVVLPLPLVLLAAEALLAPMDRWSRRVVRLAPFALAAGLYLVLRQHALGGLLALPRAHGAAVASPLVTVPVSLARYVRALVAPFPLNAYWDVAWPASAASSAALAGWLAAAVLATALVLAWRRDRVAALGLVLFGVALAPAFFTSAISGARFAERYLYLPSAGACLAVGVALERLARGPRAEAVRSGLLAAAGLAGAALVWAHLPAWKDERSLWADAAEKSPGAAEVRFNLGTALMRGGDAAGAARELRAALDLRPAPPVEASALVNLGMLLEGRGQPGQALALYARAVAANPRSYTARLNLGGALAERGRLGEAEAQLAAAVPLRPEDPSARLALGTVLLDAGRPAEAVRPLEEAARLAPDDPELRARLAEARARAGASERSTSP